MRELSLTYSVGDTWWKVLSDLAPVLQRESTAADCVHTMLTRWDTNTQSPEKKSDALSIGHGCSCSFSTPDIHHFLNYLILEFLRVYHVWGLAFYSIHRDHHIHLMAHELKARQERKRVMQYPFLIRILGSIHTDPKVFIVQHRTV